MFNFFESGNKKIFFFFLLFRFQKKEFQFISHFRGNSSEVHDITDGKSEDKDQMLKAKELEVILLQIFEWKYIFLKNNLF